MSVFLFAFLPILFAVYYTVIAAEALHPRLAGLGSKGAIVVLLSGSVWLIARSPVGWLLLGSALLTIVLGVIGERIRTSNEIASRAVLALAMTASVAMFVLARTTIPGGVFEFAGVSVLACQELAFIVRQ